MIREGGGTLRRAMPDETEEERQERENSLRRENRRLHFENDRLHAENERLHEALRQEAFNATLPWSGGAHEMTAGTCRGPGRRE